MPAVAATVRVQVENLLDQGDERGGGGANRPLRGRAGTADLTINL